MRTELTKLHQRVATTFVYVTHDQVEAMTMATRIVVMKDGLIQQVDTPQNLYDAPCNKFVAGFIGTPQMNFLDGRLEAKGEDVYFVFDRVTEVNMKPQVEPVLIKLPAEKVADPAVKEYIGKEVVAGLRPECIHDDAANIALYADAVVDTDVEVTELMGAEIYLYLKVGDEAKLTARVSSRSTSRAGDKIQVAFDAARIHLFDKDTERCIVH
jgi:multiple sugar transport system ATP-binding protein